MLYNYIISLAYAMYVKDWCNTGNKNFPGGHYSLENYNDENGRFPDGESFVNFDEFVKTEFKDENYIKSILSEDDFEIYIRVMNG